MAPSRRPLTIDMLRQEAQDHPRLAARTGRAGGPPADQAHAFAVTLVGEVDLMAEPELARMVEDFRAAACPRATVDLRAVTFIDTACLTFLARLRGIALERGGAVTIVGASTACRRTLALVGYEHSFDLVA